MYSQPPLSTKIAASELGLSSKVSDHQQHSPREFIIKKKMLSPKAIADQLLTKGDSS